MKIIAIANTYPAYNKTAFPAFDKAEEPVVFSHADSALLKDGKPFFIPEFAEPCTYQVELVVRICRLGKSIPERFASRYYDGVTVGIAFTAHGLLERFCRAGYPWDLATGFDGAAAVGNFVPTEGHNLRDLHFCLQAGGVEVQRGWSGDMQWSIDHLIAHVSQFYTIRQGDLIFTGAPVTARQAVIGDRLEAYLDGEKLLTIKVK